MIFHGFQWENDPPMESKRFLGIQWECIGLIEPTTLNNTISGSPKTHQIFECPSHADGKPEFD